MIDLHCAWWFTELVSDHDTTAWTVANNTTMFGQVLWNGQPVIDDDDGGTAGVREPRNPRPAPLAPAAMSYDESDLVTV